MVILILMWILVTKMPEAWPWKCFGPDAQFSSLLCPQSRVKSVPSVFLCICLSVCLCVFWHSHGQQFDISCSLNKVRRTCRDKSYENKNDIISHSMIQPRLAKLDWIGKISAPFSHKIWCALEYWKEGHGAGGVSTCRRFHDLMHVCYNAVGPLAILSPPYQNNEVLCKI